jgi:RNA polymerase subunit RPABC4/transcription elongation factor Spt4
MTEEIKIQKIKIEEKTDTCPVCGYTDGFHVSFQKLTSKTKIILICPDCHARFDPEWEITISSEYSY